MSEEFKKAFEDMFIYGSGAYKIGENEKGEVRVVHASCEDMWRKPTIKERFQMFWNDIRWAYHRIVAAWNRREDK